MKVFNKICQYLAIALGFAALVMFFFGFVKITGSDLYGIGGKSETLVGTVLAFGGKTAKGALFKSSVKMAVSAKILFCLVLTTIGVVMSIFSFRKKGLRYAVPLVALGDAIFMLVVALSSPWKFVDMSAFIDYDGDNARMTAGTLKYTPNVLIISILLFAFAVVAAAYLFIDDYIEVQGAKGKKTILQRIGLFFRDYKSEVKKIVWPGFSDVVKNTIIVLVVCLIVGAFIWLLDWGLASLIKFVLNIKAK